jgi:hypothetical protein
MQNAADLNQVTGRRVAAEVTVKLTKVSKVAGVTRTVIDLTRVSVWRK